MTGNITGGNINTAGIVSAAGNSLFTGSYIKVPTGTSDPGGTVPTGAAYYNTSSGVWRIYNGIIWVNA
jgi:hypothetical protein